MSYLQPENDTGGDVLQNLAYQEARDAFELARETAINKAVDANDAGNEDEAKRLLAKANAMVYTGLCWSEARGYDT